MEEKVCCAETEKADSDQLRVVVRENIEQRMINLEILIVSRNQEEKLTRTVLTELVNAADRVVQQLGYNAVSWLQQKPERAYSTIRVPCSVALTLASSVAVTSFRWKLKESGDEKESEPAEDRPTETRQDFAKTLRPRGSGKGRGSRR